MTKMNSRRLRFTFVLKMIAVGSYVFTIYYPFLYPSSWITYFFLNLAVGNLFFALAYMLDARSNKPDIAQSSIKTLESSFKQKIESAISRFNAEIEIEEPIIINVDGVPIRVRLRARKEEEGGMSYKPIIPTEG